MQAKKKICSGCSKESFIWKNEGGQRFCKSCWAKHPKSKAKPPTDKKRYVIPARSTKREALDKAYAVLRGSYLKAHPFCEARIKNVCTGSGSAIHHLYWGKDREKHMNDFANVISVCSSCHREIHDVLSAEQAIEMGFKKQDNG